MKNSSILEIFWITFLLGVILTQLYFTHKELGDPSGIEKARRM
jgi:hypothetical protein